MTEVDVVIEFGMSTDEAKSAALATLRVAGYHASSGGVRLAHPFSVRVVGLAPHDAAFVHGLVAGIDADAVVVADGARTGDLVAAS